MMKIFLFFILLINLKVFFAQKPPPPPPPKITTKQSFTTTKAYLTTKKSSTTKQSLTTTKASATTSASKSVTDPHITSWIKSTGTGYNGIVCNVYKVDYSANYVYVYSNSIPCYSIGPWSKNPNTPSAQNFIFKITRNPTKASSQTAVPLGHIGVWSNGVTMFNANDAQSYNNANVWHRNAYVWEKVSFDSCNGHPQQQGEYHIHINPICLYTLSSTKHSPILGFALDGFPVYGPYGYSNPSSSSSAISRIRTGYSLRNLSTRTTLANGTILSSSQYGPTVSSSYPLGGYIEDYVFSSSTGDLDSNNGRFAVTPEYPNGIYAYYVTIDEYGNPAFPYFIGPYFYGAVEKSNMGPGSGKNKPTEAVTTYFN